MKKNIKYIFLFFCVFLFIAYMQKKIIIFFTNGFLPSESNITNETGKIIYFWKQSWIGAFVIGFITWGLIFWSIIRYRKKKDDYSLPKQTKYNVPLEILYLVIPLIIIVIYYIYTEKVQYHINQPTRNSEIIVDIEAKQWSWDFNYIKENVYESGKQIHLNHNNKELNLTPILYLPVNKNIELRLNSRDVIHSFWVPAFLNKQDIIPGKTNYMFFIPTKEGIFDGKCAELCGEFHSDMIFKVYVVSDAQYKEYINELKNKGQIGFIGKKYNRNPNLHNEKYINGEL